VPPPARAESERLVTKPANGGVYCLDMPIARREPGEAESRRMRIERISVIAPMLNEAAHIELFVADVAAQDFAGDVELIVADGGSTDASVEKLETASEQAGLTLTRVDNPAGGIPHGLNACLRRARGDLIARLDCHSRYPSNYLSLCAAAAEETGAWSVGGIIVAHGRTRKERAVACAMDTAFGGIGFYRMFSGGDGLFSRLAGAFGFPLGGSRRAGARAEVDTVTYGAFLPLAFERVGLFDESLKVDEDEEFTMRVRRAGGKVILDPSIHVLYTPRGSLAGVFRQYYEYGRWKVPVLVKHGQLPNPRALVPIVFIFSVVALGSAAASTRTARKLLAGELALYAIASLGFGGASIRRRGEEWSLLPRVTAVFPTFHLAYGLGMLNGSLRALRR
jgi:succinoglycan biosynthesis protein ExoA